MERGVIIDWTWWNGWNKDGYTGSDFADLRSIRLKMGVAVLVCSYRYGGVPRCLAC